MSHHRRPTPSMTKRVTSLCAVETMLLVDVSRHTSLLGFLVLDAHLFDLADQIIRQLGQGTFGKVVECYDIKTRKMVDIKVIRAVQKYRDASKIEIRVLDTLRQHDPLNQK